MRELLSRIVIELRQTEGRVCEKERPIGPVDQVIRTVESLALVPVGQHRQLAVLFEPGYAPVTVLVDGESPLAVQSEPVGPWLSVFCDVRSRVAAVLPED